MLTNQQERTADYIKDKVIGYMLDDLSNMVSIPVVPNGSGNCNFPITLYIFSCIEFLGSLVSEDSIPDRPGATIDRFWAYVELTFGNNLQEFQQRRDSFIQMFRHGLTHEFFAKNSGISRHSTDLFSTSSGGKLVLDSDKFFEVFKDSCNTLKSLLDSSNNLRERVADRYLNMQIQNQNRWPSSPTVSPMTMSSGATLPRQLEDQSLFTPSFPPEDGD